MKNSYIFARNRNLCNFGLYFPEFGCHGNSLNSLENWDSIFEVADAKSSLFMRKIQRFLAQDWNQCNFGLFLIKFGCHGNSLGSLENWDSIFEFANPIFWLFMRKVPRFLAQNWNQCNFGLFLFKFGCHGNSLGSLKNSDSVLKFSSPEIPTLHAINFLICCRELMSAIFWPKFGCHGNHPDSHEILYTTFEFANPENLLIMW